MGTIICHSNQSSYPTGIKNIIYVEANVLSTYAKFQLHPPYGFWEDFLIFFKNLPFMLPQQPIKLSDLDKSHMEHGGWNMEDYTINISVKKKK